MRPFLFFVGLACGGSLGAGPQEFSSGPGHVTLLELYTSEGCSSCPSAERWLSTLEKSPGLWRDFVPVEFHVNYWDRLGWPDRFASKEGTAREYAYAASWSSGSVYTPCFVRDGAEYHPTNGNPSGDHGAAGKLSVVVQPDGTCEATFTPTRVARTTWEIHVALLGSGFHSRVTAGENRGENLGHSFVVLAQDTRKLAGDALGKTALFSLPTPTIRDAPRRGLAAWVTKSGDLEPVQAVGGWLEN